MVGPERGHPFVWCGILAKKVWSQKLWACKKKELDFSDLSLKKIRKVLRKIEEMADVFLNSSNFAKHTFFTVLNILAQSQMFGYQFLAAVLWT